MRNNTTVGIEVELNLIDRLGYIANRADEVLADAGNPGCFVAECRRSQVELNSLPFSTVNKVYRDVVEKLQLLERICQGYDVFPVCVSEFGAGSGIWRQERAIEQAFSDVLGADASSELTTISGIHAHFSQCEERLVEQYNLFLALDPLSFAITSTSPIRYDGMNSINCHRVDIVRNKIFREYPLHGQLMRYMAEAADFERQDELRCREWLGVSPLFTKTNTNFSPIRKRDTIGEGTYEVRSFDTAPISTAFGAIALYKGVIDAVISYGCPVRIADVDNTYVFETDRVVLPSFRTVKDLEKEAIMYGLKSERVRQYLRALLPLAQRGLPQEDLPYLEQLYRELRSGLNPADEIMGFLRARGYTQSKFTPRECAQANLFMREKYLMDLEI